MDEADYLGDRIAIMGEGLIKTWGTSMFLKEKFSVGYTLDIFSEDNTSNENKKKVKEIVESMIPKCTYEPDITTDLSFKLPIETSKHFAELFEKLESQ